MNTYSFPRVSVLMLTRNHAPFINKAIQSVQAQTLQDWELLIGEDDSTDDTGLIAGSAAALDPRISVYSSTDSALGFHRNFARILSEARAPYVAFLEGDDWWSEPRKLELQVTLLESNHQFSFCGGRTRVFDQRSHPCSDSDSIGPLPNQVRLSFEDLIRSYSFHFSSIMMRTSCVNLPDWIFHQYCLDRPLYLLAATYGDAGVIDSELSVYRLHEGGVWAPLSPLEKASRSHRLFSTFCRYFPSYRSCFRRTLSHVLWSYLGTSLRVRNRLESISIFLMAVFAAPGLRIIEHPRLTLGVVARIILSFR